MKNRILFSFLILGSILAVMAFTPAPKKIKVYLIGDSTASIKDTRYYPETGWGMPFAIFFDSTAVVDNRAKNGRSTRTFMEENRWAPVVESLQEGDYVFIQFGHNDEVSTKKSYTNPEAFKAHLIRYIKETRDKKAIPVLMTSVARRQFDSTGVLVDSHKAYAALTREVAKETGVAFIDVDQKSREMILAYGIDKSKLLFNHLEKGEHPNYPDGIQDNTHLNELGARKIAELILSEIITMNLELSHHVFKPAVKSK